MDGTGGGGGKEDVTTFVRQADLVHSFFLAEAPITKVLSSHNKKCHSPCFHSNSTCS